MGALLLLEGLTSVALLVHDVRAVRPTGNFRRAVYDTLLGWIPEPNQHLADSYGPHLTLTTNADGMRLNPAADNSPSADPRRDHLLG